MINFQLSDSDFEKFKELIYREAGIHLTEMKKALVQARLTKRIRALGLVSFSDYHRYLLDNSEKEMVNFINSITTNKTEFFRESKHFEFINDFLLPHLEEKRVNRIRIWSAGCSTGEEPYTLAITVLEYFRDRPLPDVKILATDIDTMVLEKGEQGIYREDQLVNMDRELVQRYFMRGKGEDSGLYQVKDFVKKLVFFRRLNLQIEAYPMKGPFHMIFCRNVIIYFDKDTQKRLFKRFHRYLDDDGYLFIGHSENISNLTKRFSLVGNTTYRKVLDLKD